MKTMLAVPLAAGLTLSTAAAAEARPACQHHFLPIHADLCVNRASFYCCQIDVPAPAAVCQGTLPFSIHEVFHSNHCKLLDDASIKCAYLLLPSSLQQV